MFYVSRYSNPEINNLRHYTVGITLGKPRFQLKFVENFHSYALAPKGWMWNIESDDDFKEAYWKMLDDLGVEKVKHYLDQFETFANGKDVVMLCYEDVRDPDQCCHRTMLSEWIGEKLGIKVPELDDPSPVKYKKKKATKAVDTRTDEGHTAEQKPQGEQLSFL